MQLCGSFAGTCYVQHRCLPVEDEAVSRNESKWLSPPIVSHVPRTSNGCSPSHPKQCDNEGHVLCKHKNFPLGWEDQYDMGILKKLFQCLVCQTPNQVIASVSSFDECIEEGQDKGGRELFCLTAPSPPPPPPSII